MNLESINSSQIQTWNYEAMNDFINEQLEHQITVSISSMKQKTNRICIVFIFHRNAVCNEIKLWYSNLRPSTPNLNITT